MTSIHPTCVCKTKDIGNNTAIAPLTYIAKKVKIGNNCTIGSHVVMENNVEIGYSVVIEGGVRLQAGLKVANNVFIGTNATFVSDHQKHGAAPQTHVGSGVFVGANSTISSGIKIGRDARITEGSVVTRDVPAKSIVAGNPAYITKYTDTATFLESGTRNSETYASEPVIKTSIAKVTLHNLKSVPDLRGNLSVGNFGSDIPFTPKRFFLVDQVSNLKIRGEHAHKVCQQFLVCVSGTISVIVDNGEKREEFTLDRSNLGLYLPPMIWAVQYKHSANSVLLVFASEEYDPEDYIRDYEEFLTHRLH